MKTNHAFKCRNLLIGFGIPVVYLLLFKSFGFIIKEKLHFAEGTFLPDLIGELFGTAVAVTFLFIFRKKHLLKAEKGSFRVGLSAGMFMLIAPTVLAFFQLLTVSDKTLNPAHEILFFVFNMILTGVTEELIFRGIVLDSFHSVFGSSTKSGAFATACLSGGIFGALHLFNLIGSENPSAIFIQAVGAVGAGFYLGAVYLRCRNLWALMFMHAVNDFMLMLNEGLFATGTLRNAVDSHSAKALIGAVLYFAIGMYLLRAEKMYYAEPHSEKGTALSRSNQTI